MSEKKNEAADAAETGEKTHPIAQRPATPPATELGDEALEQVSGGMGPQDTGGTRSKTASKHADAVSAYIKG
ncbi:MAG: hypothetical protein ABI584_08555 [Acidobacteriota bacterium]